MEARVRAAAQTPNRRRRRRQALEIPPATLARQRGTRPPQVDSPGACRQSNRTSWSLSIPYRWPALALRNHEPQRDLAIGVCSLAAHPSCTTVHSVADAEMAGHRFVNLNEIKSVDTNPGMSGSCTLGAVVSAAGKLPTRSRTTLGNNVTTASPTGHAFVAASAVGLIIRVSPSPIPEPLSIRSGHQAWFSEYTNATHKNYVKIIFTIMYFPTRFRCNTATPKRGHASRTGETQTPSARPGSASERRRLSHGQ